MIKIDPKEVSQEEMDESLREFAEDVAQAIENGICTTQKVWRIPFTGLQIGWNRMTIATTDHRTRLIEIRIWWSDR